MARRIIYLIFCLFGVLAWARPLMVGYSPWAGNLLLDVAETQGYWKRAGVEVKLARYEEYDDLFKALVERKIDVIYDMSGTFVDLHQQGYPLTILAETDWSHGGDKVVAHNEVQGAAQIKGKTIGIYLNRTSVLFFLDRFLQKQGLSLADVKVQELEDGPLAQAFSSGKIRLMVNYDPPATEATRDGKAHELASSADFPGVIPEGFAVHQAARKELGDEVLIRFLQGIVESSRWLHGSAKWPQIADLLSKRTLAGGEYSALEIAGMYNSVRFHTLSDLSRRNLSEQGQLKFLTELRQFMLKQKRLSRDFTAASLFDSKPLAEAIKRSGK